MAQGNVPEIMTDAKRILLAASDSLLRHSLADQLAGQGFAVTEADCAPFDPVLIEHAPDAVLIDDGGADDAALTLCRDLHGHNPRLPILILAADAGRAAWSDAGATAVIAKPVRLAVLLDRLRGLIREDDASEPILLDGGICLDRAARTISDDTGWVLALTEKEVAILSYLYEAGDRAVPRDELLAEVWGYAGDVSTHTVETHIYRLRRKLGSAAALLATDEGGYRLIGAPDSSRSTITGT